MSKLFTIAKSPWGHASNVFIDTCQQCSSQKNNLEPTYTIEYKNDAVVLDTVTANTTDGDDMTALINTDGIPTAEIFTRDHGEYKAQRRFASMAWKFIGDGGVKYKWHVFQQGRQWEFRDTRTHIVAIFTNNGPFSDIQGELSVLENISESTMRLLLLSWGLVRKTLDDERAMDHLSHISKRYISKHDWYADGFYSALNRAGAKHENIRMRSAAATADSPQRPIASV